MTTTKKSRTEMDQQPDEPLSVRDEIALAALAAILSRGPGNGHAMAVRDAFGVADMFLAERARPRKA